MTHLSWVMAAATCMAVALITSQLFSPNLPSPPPYSFILSDDSGSYDLLLRRAEEGLATVCRNCDVVSQWPALHRWSPGYLQERAEGPLLASIHRGEPAPFVYQRASSLLDGLPQVQRFREQTLAAEERVRLDARKFFSLLLAADDDRAITRAEAAGTMQIYYAGGIESFSRAAEADLVPVNESLWLTEHRRDNPLWMGHRGVTVEWHFDYSHNVYVQLFGTKSFCLLPHHAHNCTFPFSHPGWRQSSLSFFNNASPNSTTNSTTNSTKLINLMPLADCISLNPGDVLYVPPFAWHRVTAESVSISVSFFCEQAQLVEDALTSLPIPFDESWPSSAPAAFVAALALYIDTFWPEARTHVVRFRYLPALGSIACSDTDLSSVCPPVRFSPLGYSSREALIERFREGAASVEETLRGKGAEIPLIRMTLLGTYLDKLVMSFVPNPHHVNIFLQCCRGENLCLF